MPNLIQLATLREKFSQSVSYRNKIKEREIQFLFENFNRSKGAIEKAFQNQNLTPEVITYFENQEEAHVVNLFIDITSFSTKASLMTNKELSNYLDFYYNKAIPIIYKHGGEIEKIIGDGIICVFGEPFLDDSLPELIKKADSCSKEIIVELGNSQWEVKVALHNGVIQYYKNKSFFAEYTMIGQPLTDLFRLESVSKNMSINFFCDAEYDKLHNSNAYTQYIKGKEVYWKRSGKTQVTLKGCDYQHVRNYEKVDELLEFDEDYDFERGAKRLQIAFNKRYLINESKNKIPDKKLSNNSQSYFINSTVLVVHIKVLEKEKKVKLIHTQTIIPEVLNIFKASKSFYSMKLHNEHLIGIFDTPYKSNVQEVFSLGARINSMIKIANYYFSENGKIQFGIGISDGEILISAIEDENTDQNHLLFQGNPYTEAIEMSKAVMNKIAVNSVVYNNLSENQKRLLGFNYDKNFYFGSIIRTKIDNWHEKKLK